MSEQGKIKSAIYYLDYHIQILSHIRTEWSREISISACKLIAGNQYLPWTLVEYQAGLWAIELLTSTRESKMAINQKVSSCQTMFKVSVRSNDCQQNKNYLKIKS